MNPEDAEEYTEGLGQIVAGARRQVEEGARLGVPQALGMSPSEWIETRLGGSPDGKTAARPQAEPAVPASDGAEAESPDRGKRLFGRIPHALRKPSADATEPASRPDGHRISFHYSPRHWLLIPICGVLGLLVGLTWAASAPAIYKSQSAAFVSMTALPTENPYHSDPFGGSQFALQRVQSYAQLATSPRVIQAAINELHRPDAAEVAKNVNVSSTGGVMLWVTVEDRDAQASARLADSVMANLVRSVATLEGDGGQRAPVQIVPVQPAIVPEQPEATGGFLKTLGGLVAGLGLGFGAFRFIRSRRDDTKRDAVPARPKPNAHDDSPSVVMLRVGDGRDFTRKVGR
jgi:capsular polysaccharide biosynthesis protein